MTYNFSQPESLYRLARSGATIDRKTLAQSVTSLLSTSLTSSERGLAQDILIQLLSEAELDLRKGLAEQLAVDPNCPQALLDFLIFENPFIVSQSILRLSEKLSDEYLIEVAKRFDNSDYWIALAQRKNIGEDLCRFLIGTDDPQVFQILVENQGSRFCSSGIHWLVSAAPYMPEIQRSLISRPEVTAEMATQLYCHVSEELRKDIESRFTIDPQKLKQAMERVILHRMAPKKPRPRITVEAVLKADRMKQEGKISSRQIVEAMKKGDISLYVCLWGALLEIDPDMILAKLEEDVIATMAILAHSARMTRSDYNAMFIQWRREKPFSESHLETKALPGVMAIFDKMTCDKSHKIISLWKEQKPQTIH